MPNLDRKHFVEIFFGMEEYFGKKHKKVVVEMYFQGLQDLSQDQFRLACRKAVRQGRFFPMISELREYAEVDKNPGHEEKAMLAWVNFYQTLRIHGASVLNMEPKGASESGIRLDPIVYRVIRMLGGAERIRMWTEEEIPFRQKEFIDYYALAMEHDAAGALPIFPEKSTDKSLPSTGRMPLDMDTGSVPVDRE